MPPRRAAAAAAAATAPATVTEDEQQQETEEGLATLQFDEPLTWRAGRPIPTGELIRRLDVLSKELSDLEQETTDTNSLTKVAKELVSHNLLSHKDKGVKAFVACCLVDILRICAPNAPFTPSQLKDVFNLFITFILPALQDPDNTYNNQHRYVLSSLSEVQSIVLLNDIDHNEALLLHLFSSFFDAVSGPKSASGERIPKDVELHMVDILTTVIEEGTGLPHKVVDVIMAQFLRAAAPGASARDKAEVDEGQATLLPKVEPEAYLMAKSVCSACPDKMARFVAQYFSDVIMDVSNLGGGPRRNGHRGADDDDDEEHIQGPSEADLKELRKAHLLLRELWRACPLVLPNVIPQVDAELSADNVHLRQLATETLGDMISGIGAAGPPPPVSLDPAAYPPPKLADYPESMPSASFLTTPLSPQSFAQTHAAIYQNFVNRKHDKAPSIRAAWTTAVGYVLATSAGGVGLTRDDESVLVKGLGEKLNDNDEKVRLAAVKAIECFSFRDLITKLAPDGGVTKEGSVLGSLADRCRDRRPHVRVEAMVLLGKLWAASTGELASNPEAVAALQGIPTKIFAAVYANDPELNLLIDRVVFECLIPLSFPPLPKKAAKSANGGSQSQTLAPSSAAQVDQDEIRAHRILLLVAALDNNSKSAFFAIQRRQSQLATVVDAFIKACDGYNGGMAGPDGKKGGTNLNSTINYLAALFPDPDKVRTDLLRFAKVNDRRCYQLVRYVISRESDYKSMHRALRELNKRYQSGGNAHIMDTLLPLLYRSGQIMYNKSHLSTFLEYSKSKQDGLAAVAHEILNEISQNHPTLFKSHIGSLCKDLQDEAPTASKPNEPIMVETLRACASFAARYPNEISSDNNFIQALESYALYGKPPKAAKYAVNVLLARKDDRSMVVATNLLQKIMKNWQYGAPHFLNKLATVSQLERLAPKVTEDHEDAILDMAFHQILRTVRTDARDDDPQWVEDADLDEEIQAKCLALKLLVNQLLAIPPGQEAAKQKTEGTMRLLRTVVARDGEISKAKDGETSKPKATPLHHRKRLRLLAGQLLLKLCVHSDDYLPPADFNRLAEVAQDGCPKVRRFFIEKLQKYLTLGKVRPRFYTIVFLAAYEPNEDFRQSVETWIRSRVRHFQESKSMVMEQTMARLLSLLAHHPDFDRDLDALACHARYVLFYVSNVATEANLGMIYKYAERTKQTRDAIDPAKSENVYILCDLALAVLRKWQEKRGWVFEAYPSKIGLPVGLYTSLQSHDDAQKIAETQYVPDGIDEKLDELIKAVDRRKKRKYDDRADAQNPAKKAKAPAKSAQPKVAKPSKTASSKRHSALKSKKAKRPTASSSSPVNDADRRRSGRSRQSKSYMERDSSEDDDEMLEGVAEWDYFSGDDDEKGEKRREASQAKRRAAAGAGLRSGSSSVLSEPESDAMDEDENGADAAQKEDDGGDEEMGDDNADKASEADEDGGGGSDGDNGVDDQDGESEKETPKPAARTNGGRATRTASASATTAPKPKAAPKKAAVSAAKQPVPPKAGKTQTRLASRAKPKAGRRTAAKDAYDMEDDD